MNQLYCLFITLGILGLLQAPTVAVPFIVNSGSTQSRKSVNLGNFATPRNSKHQYKHRRKIGSVRASSHDRHAVKSQRENQASTWVAHKPRITTKERSLKTITITRRKKYGKLSREVFVKTSVNQVKKISSISMHEHERRFNVGGSTKAPATKTSSRPTAKPTSMPTTRLTSKPSSRPTSKPSVRPTSRPTSKPSSRPTSQPTPRPTPRPTSKLSSRPTAKPTSMPTIRPTSKPTDRSSSSGRNYGPSSITWTVASLTTVALIIFNII